MRAIRVASAALLGVTALALVAPAVVASDGDSGHDVTPFGFGVLPRTIAPGGQLTLQIDRDGSGCRGTATVASGAFDTVRIPAGRPSAVTTVDRAARAGAVHRVTFTCDGISGSTDLTIAEGGPDDTGLPPVPGQQVPRAVQAGEGGSSAGFDLKEIALGAALIVGSVGTAYRLGRRREGEDGG
ncbi:hypothetical protein FNH09_42695 [Streptomyces adustus]|uniref:Lipoprotein n=1 Tax=Streptomyces adustus TaxID=1609272 RepID=A0A5N8VQW6_9ACTN|nr:hypothetical protein [Streptomyces adustus]MPY37683.1 hypothetical protein [Streptomyces adustus]